MESVAGSLQDEAAAQNGQQLIKLASKVLFGLAVGYLAVCATIYGWQSHLVFKPDTHLYSTPGDYRFPVTDVTIPLPESGPDRQFLHGWWIPSDRPAARTVLYLHGNDGNVSTSMSAIEPLRQMGLSVFLIDYRGYGQSGGGFPSESGVYQDAQAAWDYLVRTRGVHPTDLLIYGQSLGGAIAIDLATHHPEAAGLVVESSFTSIRDMAGLEGRYALLPVNLILNQRFESIDKVGRLRLPVLYVHGTDDDLVPFDMGLALYHATPSALGFVAVPHARHEDSTTVGGAQFRTALDGFVHRADQVHGPMAVIKSRRNNSG